MRKSLPIRLRSLAAITLALAMLASMTACLGGSHTETPEDTTAPTQEDIPCIIMGNAKHAWNLVQMDDGKWYRLDITNACRLGWDGDLPATPDDYFADTFLNNNTLLNIVGTYNDPYMISLNNVPLVTEFPEHAEAIHHIRTEPGYALTDWVQPTIMEEISDLEEDP